MPEQIAASPTPTTAPQAQVQHRALPMQTRAAGIQPSTYNEAAGTVEVVWTTGERVRRRDYWSGEEYEEELDVSADAVDMSRFDSGAVNVLDSHSTYGLSSIIGTVVRASVSGGQGRALLKLSVRQEMAGIVADIKAGVIRNISVGYNVSRYEVIDAKARTDGVGVQLRIARRWQPAELSFVAVPADMASNTRSKPAEAACEFITQPAGQVASHPTPSIQPPEERSMPAASTATQDQQPGAAAPNAPAGTAAAPVAPTAEAAAQRAADVVSLCVRHGVADQAAGFIQRGLTLEAAGLEILNARAAKDTAAGGHVNKHTPHISTVGDETQTRLRGLEEALLHRVDPSTKLTDHGRQYRGMSLVEMGRDHLERAGINVRGLDKMELAGHMLRYSSPGMHHTSDFASLLGGVAQRRLRDAYDRSAITYRQWARRGPNAVDFRANTAVQMGTMPRLLLVPEGAEYKHGTVGDSAESYTLATYGRMFSMTRQAIINDDLGAFSRSLAGWAAEAARTENTLAYEQLLSTTMLMADGVALFHASHNNLLTGAPSALSFDSLKAMRALMRKQKSGQDVLNISPSVLLVPAALEQLAYQLTSSNYVPAKQSDVNEFRTGGRTALETIVEPILDGVSETAWFGLATGAGVDGVEYGYLEGAEGPVVESQEGWFVDGTSWKIRLDFWVKALDYRGMVKAMGA